MITTYVNVPAVIISLAITAYVKYNYAPIDHSHIIGIASPVATVAGILFGFVCAAVIFLAGNSTNKFIDNLRGVGLLDHLMKRMGSLALALIISCTFLVLAVFMPSKNFSVFDLQITVMNIDYLILLLGLFSVMYSLIDFTVCWGRVLGIVKRM